MSYERWNQPCRLRDGLVHETYKGSWEECGRVFARLDNKPVRSASIGQVHRAMLKDGFSRCREGQYGAGNEQVMGTTSNTARSCLGGSRQQVAVLDEVEAQFATEFDYAGRRIAKSPNPQAGFWAAGGEVCRYSRTVSDMCTKGVLVMRFLDDNLVDGIRTLGKERLSAKVSR